jgi:hypothetical protein
VAEQQQSNAELKARNDALFAEVQDLREGLDAIEERARSELGLVGEDESFYLIVDPEIASPALEARDQGTGDLTPPEPNKSEQAQAPPPAATTLNGDIEEQDTLVDPQP